MIALSDYICDHALIETTPQYAHLPILSHKLGGPMPDSSRLEESLRLVSRQAPDAPASFDRVRDAHSDALPISPRGAFSFWLEYPVSSLFLPVDVGPSNEFDRLTALTCLQDVLIQSGAVVDRSAFLSCSIGSDRDVLLSHSRLSMEVTLFEAKDALSLCSDVTMLKDPHDPYHVTARLTDRTGRCVIDLMIRYIDGFESIEDVERTLRAALWG